MHQENRERCIRGAGDGSGRKERGREAGRLPNVLRGHDQPMHRP